MREGIFWLGLLVGLFFAIRKPLLGIILYSALNLIRPEMLFWGSNTGSKSIIIVFGITFISVVNHYPKSKNIKIINRETFLLLFLYFSILISISLSSYEIHNVYLYANEIGKIFIFCCLMILAIDDETKVIQYEKYVLFILVILGLWGIQQHFLGNERLEGLGGNAFPDTNGIAALFVLYFPVALGNAINSKKIKLKMVWTSSTIIIALLIIFTMSRGGFLGMSIGAAIFILKSKSKLKILSISIVFIFLIVPFISSDYVERLGTILPSEDGEMESSANSRLYLWIAGLMVFADNPVFGSGFLTYPEAKMVYEYRFQKILEPEVRSYIFRKDNKKVTHNTYISILAEGGIFAAFPFYLLVFGTLVENRKLINQSINIIDDDDKLLKLLSFIDTGIIGYCVCIFFIDAVLFVVLPWQIVICSIIRRLLYEKINLV